MRTPTLVLAVVLTALPAAAVDYFVSPTGSDGNDCLSDTTPCATIQAAVDRAADGDAVLVAAGTYVENVLVDKNVRVDGEDGTVVDGGAAGSVFTVTGDAELREMEIRNGAADRGAGVEATGGTITLRRLTITGNVATGDGGGLFIATGEAILNETWVGGNEAGGDGGGVMVFFGFLTSHHSTVSGNVAGDQGGGIASASSSTTLNNTSVSGNVAAGDGGGIALTGGGTHSVNSSTVAFNRAPSAAGIDHGGGSVAMRNSVVHGNVAAASSPDCSGTIDSGGYNLFGDTDGCTLTGDTATVMIGVNPVLSALGDHGGWTPTHHLGSGSPAIDAGTPGGCLNGAGGTLTRDQVGRARDSDCAAGQRCDIGAYENHACTAFDAIAPAEVSAVMVVRQGTAAVVSWDAVTSDLLGNPETIDHYRVYGGTTPDFVPDRASFTDVAGISTTTSFAHEVIGDGQTYYYLVAAVDVAGNERQARAARVTTPPVLTAVVGGADIDLSWTDAQPSAEVAGYRVYWGTEPGSYVWSAEVGPTTTHTLTGLTPMVPYVMAVAVIDGAGNEGAFSNEEAGKITASTVDVNIVDWSHHCFGSCPPRKGELQRDAKREILVPFSFPQGDWVKIEATLTLDSRATVNNPSSDCVWPNSTGDIFDRLFSVFLVEDDTCLDLGRCWGNGDQLELIHGVTPFGTDSMSTSPRVPESVFTVDITPFRALLVGRKHIGVNVNTWDGKGWWAKLDLHFSEVPADASPKPPADGIQLIHFSAGSPTSTDRSVTIPATATDVRMRLWVSGHGGATVADCPGLPADEFCARWSNVLVDDASVWRFQPWRTDCSPLGQGNCSPGSCRDWNACGCPSCTFDRSAWCPGLLTCHENEPCDQDIDANAWLPPGETHDFRYEVENPSAGSWWSFSSVLYWYE